MNAPSAIIKKVDHQETEARAVFRLLERKKRPRSVQASSFQFIFFQGYYIGNLCK